MRHLAPPLSKPPLIERFERLHFSLGLDQYLPQPMRFTHCPPLLGGYYRLGPCGVMAEVLCTSQF
jgi:hypothetical protein